MSGTRIRRGELVTRGQDRTDYRTRRRVVFSLAGVFVVIVIALMLVSSLTKKTVLESHGATTFNYRAVGFRAAFDLAARLGHARERWTRDYLVLPEPETHALLLLAPGIGREGSGPVRPEALVDWVRRGGRALVGLRGPSDAVLGNFVDRAQEFALLGPLAAALPEIEGAKIGGPWNGVRGMADRRFRFREVEGRVTAISGAHLISDQSQKLPVFASGKAEEPHGEPVGDASDDGLFVPLLERPGSGLLAVEKRVGAGSVIVCSSAFPFSNAGLRYAGSGELVAALFDHVAGGAGDAKRRTMFFDEHTHGIGGPVGTFTLFFKPPTLWLTLTAFVAAVIMLWFGMVRLGRPRLDRAVPRRAREEFVVSMAGLYGRSRRFDLMLSRVVAGYEERLLRAAGQRDVLHDRRSDDVPRLEQVRALREAATRLSPRTRSGLVGAVAEIHGIFEAGMAALRGQRYTGGHESRSTS